MPNRIIREGILTSERVDQLQGWAAECFYRRLMSVVDDFGRFYGNASLIRAACYPLKIDKVSNADIEKWLADCAGAALVSTYEIDGKRYLQLQDFRQQVRAHESKFPAPDGRMQSKCVAGAQQMKSNAHLDGVVVGDVSEGGDGGDKARKRAKSRHSPLPENFSISERVQQWADEKGHKQLPERLEQFISYAKRNGKTYVDWDEALMGAIREDWAKLSKGQTNGYVSGKDAERKRVMRGLTGYDPDAIPGVSQRVD